jgi:hypothetical protein
VPSVSKNTRAILAVLAGVAVLYFGNDGNDGEGVTSAVVVLAVAAAVIVWFLTRPQDTGGNK